MSKDSILVASRSEAVANFVINIINQIKAVYEIRKAANSKDIINAIRNNSPKILFMEASFYKRATTFRVLELINEYHNMRVIIFGLEDYDDCLIKRFYKSGIDGYINFREGQEIYKENIKEALIGHYIISPKYESTFESEMYEIFSHLTKREQEIITLVLQELDNNKIARALDIKTQTVKNIRKEIYEKLHVNNVVVLVKILLLKKLVDIDEFINN